MVLYAISTILEISFNRIQINSNNDLHVKVISTTLHRTPYISKSKLIMTIDPFLFNYKFYLTLKPVSKLV